MKMNLWPCTPEEARKLFFLTPNGELRRQKQPDVPITTKATKGVASILCEGKTFNIARTIWCLAYGDWPAYQLKHLDGNPSNNWVSNLELNLSAAITGFEAARRAEESDKLFLAPRTRPLFSAKTYKESEV